MDNVQKHQITVKLHYLRPEGDYDGWNAWMWTLTKGGTQYDFAQEGKEQVATILVDGYTTTYVPEGGVADFSGDQTEPTVNVSNELKKHSGNA